MFRRLVSFALVAAMGLSACGGSDKKSDSAATTATTASTTTTTLPPITKAAFVEQANGICETMNEKSDAIPDPGEDLGKMVTLMEELKKIAVDGLAQLRALRMPAGDEAAINAIWAKFEIPVGEIEQALTALRAGDLEKFGTIAEQIDKHGTESNAASNAYGLTVCGEE